MKTTIDLPDALSAEVRNIARSQGTTVRELVVDGLRGELERRRTDTRSTDFACVTVSGNGLQPGADPDRWVELGYGSP